MKRAPEDAVSLATLAGAYERVGLTVQAVSCYTKAVRLRPDWLGAANDLAWILATNPNPLVRNTTEAVRLAEEVCRKSDGREPSYLDTLAAALAAAGRYDDAVRTAQQAVELAESAGRADVAQRTRGQLEFYKANLPYREGSRLVKTKPAPPKPPTGRAAAKSAFVRRARSLVDEGQLRQAGQMLLSALAIDRDDAELLAQLAVVRERQGRIHEAIGY